MGTLQAESSEFSEPSLLEQSSSSTIIESEPIDIQAQAVATQITSEAAVAFVSESQSSTSSNADKHDAGEKVQAVLYCPECPSQSQSEVEEKFPKENFRVNREMRDEILVYDLFLSKFWAKMVSKCMENACKFWI